MFGRIESSELNPRLFCLTVFPLLLQSQDFSSLLLSNTRFCASRSGSLVVGDLQQENISQVCLVFSTTFKEIPHLIRKFVLVFL